MMDTAEVLKNIALGTKQPAENELRFRLGTVDPNHTTGRPRVRFDGETTLSDKAYPYLASYTPSANDRVLLIRVGKTSVIAGRIV